VTPEGHAVACRSALQANKLCESHEMSPSTNTTITSADDDGTPRRACAAARTVLAHWRAPRKRTSANTGHCRDHHCRESAPNPGTSLHQTDQAVPLDQCLSFRYASRYGRLVRHRRHLVTVLRNADQCARKWATVANLRARTQGEVCWDRPCCAFLSRQLSLGCCVSSQRRVGQRGEASGRDSTQVDRITPTGRDLCR
jgi:hypothetical protein